MTKKIMGNTSGVKNNGMLEEIVGSLLNGNGNPRDIVAIKTADFQPGVTYVAIKRNRTPPRASDRLDPFSYRDEHVELYARVLQQFPRTATEPERDLFNESASDPLTESVTYAGDALAIVKKGKDEGVGRLLRMLKSRTSTVVGATLYDLHKPETKPYLSAALRDKTGRVHHTLYVAETRPVYLRLSNHGS